MKVIDLPTKAELASAVLPNPEPASVVAGRPMLYDATHNSGNGEAACASCHIFGDEDDLAWDLGNPDDAVKANPLGLNLGDPLIVALGKGLFKFRGDINGTGNPAVFHPMKGPMTTQTLRGLANSGAMHWRGDRSNGQFGVDATDAQLSFDNFIVAFQGLIGSTDAPPVAQMQQFTDFQLQVTLPPNPVRKLDNSLTSAQSAGKSDPRLLVQPEHQQLRARRRWRQPVRRRAAGARDDRGAGGDVHVCAAGVGGEDRRDALSGQAPARPRIRARPSLSHASHGACQPWRLPAVDRWWAPARTGAAVAATSCSSSSSSQPSPAPPPATRCTSRSRAPRPTPGDH